MNSIEINKLNENMKQLATGLSSINIVQDSLQEELGKLRTEKEVDRKEFEKLILNANQKPKCYSSDEEDNQYLPMSRNGISIQRQRARGNDRTDGQPSNSTTLPGHAEAAAAIPSVDEDDSIQSVKPQVPAEESISMTREMLRGIVANALEDQKYRYNLTVLL
ncbi:MAG: hypothetical protein JJV94_03160 [Sulfurospirillum sp.]|nr:hypothetical protein [Sulfurospirillum sp.]